MVNYVVFGIDPGINGAICALNMDDYSVRVARLSTIKKGHNRILNGLDLAGFISGYLVAHNTPNTRFAVWIEDVHSMPKQGVSGVFNFGESLGIIEGVCHTLAHDMSQQVRYVTPQLWKRTFGLIGTKKDQSRLNVIVAEPSIAGQLRAANTVDLADAYWIAKFGMGILEHQIRVGLVK